MYVHAESSRIFVFVLSMQDRHSILTTKLIPSVAKINEKNKIEMKNENGKWKMKMIYEIDTDAAADGAAASAAASRETTVKTVVKPGAV